MTRRPIIAGNWKMHKTISEAVALAQEIVRSFSEDPDVDIVLCPAFTALGPVAEVLKGSQVWLGAQNLHWEAKGAFTGEVSAAMLCDAGCQAVIIGHSERRQFFGETNESVNRKLKAALARNLLPIVCVGETLAQRQAGKTFDVIRDHVMGGYQGLSPQDAARTVAAYEPVWAIGTGVNATPAQAQEAHAFIRKLLAERFGDSVAGSIRIQYGGSVKPDNIASLLEQNDVDGALVGGASLEAASFIQILRQAKKVRVR